MPGEMRWREEVLPLGMRRMMPMMRGFWTEDAAEETRERLAGEEKKTRKKFKERIFFLKKKERKKQAPRKERCTIFFPAFLPPATPKRKGVISLSRDADEAVWSDRE